MALNIENTSGGVLDVNDLGITMAVSEVVDIELVSDPQTVAISAASGDLNTLITAGDLTVKDPIDGTTNLSVADGLSATRSHNETHWRLGSGSRIGDLSDVDTSGLGTSQVLEFNGTTWVPIATPGAGMGNYGQNFAYAEQLGVLTITNTTPQTRVTLNTGSVPAGTFLIEASYGWNCNSTNDAFISQVTEDASMIGELHFQDPSDSGGSFGTTGTNQRHYAHRRFFRTLTAASYTYTLDFYSQNGGVSVSMWDASLTFLRVG